MRKYILLLITLCLHIAARGQTEWRYDYWFDNDRTTLKQGSSHIDSWRMDADISSLSESLHTFHFQVMCADTLPSIPITRYFIKYTNQAQASTRYWFDDDVAHVNTISSQAGTVNLDVSRLPEGLHTLHVQVLSSEGTISSTASRLFYKTFLSTGIQGQYWFDDDIANKHISPQAQGLFDIDVRDLEEGFHTIHYQVVGTGGHVSSMVSRSFYKVYLSEGISWRCWFDNDFSTVQEGEGVGSTLLLDVTQIADGYHTLHVQVDGSPGVSSVPVTKGFVKVPQTIGVDDYTCLCMVDDQLYKQEKVPAGGGIVAWNFDVSQLPQGFHRMFIQVVTPSGAASNVYESFFLREATHSELAEMKCVYAIDGAEFNTEAGTVSNGAFHFDLDVSSLEDGLHRISYMLSNGKGVSTKTQTQFFIKTPLGGNGITEYWYWQNEQGDSQARKVKLAERKNPFSLISLLPIQSLPIRSSCFEFKVKDGQPTILAKNEIHLRFYDAAGRFTDISKQYVDENVKQEITDIELLEAGAHATTERPAENAVKWYCVEALHGDSLSFKADQPCTLQLFSSGGEELYHASGVDALKYGGRYAEVDGTYYLALHDVTANNADNVSIDYLHIDKFALLEVDVDEIGVAPSIVPMTLHGNGFDKLKRISLSLNGDSIIADCQDVIDKATAIAMFTLQGGEQLGAYTLTLEFENEEDGTVRLSLPDRIHLATPVWGEVAVDVTMARTLATPYPVTIKVENTGNVARLYTPLTIAYNRPDIVRKMNFENFFVSMRNQDYNPVVWTDNFAGTGQRAQSMYLFIPTLAPGETKEVKVSFDAPSHQEVELFVETGPSTNETKSLTKVKEENKDEQNEGNQQGTGSNTGQEGQDETGGTGGQEETGSNTGQEGQDETGGTGTGGQEETPENSGTGRDCMMVPSLWDYLYEHTDFMPSEDLLDNLEELDLPGLAGRIIERAQQARQVANDARGIGRLLGNVVNGIRLHHYMAVADAAGVDDEMRETLRSSVHLELPSEILNDAGHPFLGAMAALWEWHQMHSECNEEQPTPHTVHILNVGDPNDIVGYMAESGSKYMTEGTTDVYYTIEFENDPEIANAAAHTIVVKDTLDTSRFDLSTFTATGVKIGSVEMELNGEKSFSKKTMDLRPAIDVIAQVSLSLDEQKGIATWTIESLDPMSMEPTEDAMQGVLPVNYNGNGQGELTFDIKLKPGMVEGESVSNRAGIVFDQEGEIMTPVWTNTVDATQPESSVMEVAMATDTTVNVKIEAYDELSKPWKYDLYVQESADGTWLRKAVNIPVDSMVQMRVEEGVSYGFYVVVTDSAGNVEQKEAAREYTFEVFGSQVDTDTQIALAQGWNWISHNQQEPLNVEALKPAGSRMVGQTEELIDDQRLGWMGDLEELLPTQMYKLQMDEPRTIQLSGRLFNAGFRSVPLYEGWNWLGYPVAHTMTPAEALLKLEAEEGDMLVGQDGIATYSDGQWTGTLIEMQPGQGFMYRSASDKNLFYNATAQASSRRANARSATLSAQLSEAWTADKRKYPSVMGVIAQLWHDSEQLDATEWVLGAFCGEECRGVSSLVGEMLMMNVYGTGAEMIRFYVQNVATGEVLPVAETELFQADVLGTMQQPYAMHIGEPTGISLAPGSSPKGKERIYMLDGRRVDDSQLKPGVYVVGDGKKGKTQKIIRR